MLTGSMFSSGHPRSLNCEKKFLNPSNWLWLLPAQLRKCDSSPAAVPQASCCGRGTLPASAAAGRRLASALGIQPEIRDSRLAFVVLLRALAMEMVQ